MARDAARRMMLIRRTLAVLLLVACAAVAVAGWENTRFCRLGPDRLLLIAGNQRFVLSHGAAWELVDATQQTALGKWLDQHKLTKDLGQLVASAPSDHEVPLAGKVDAVDSAPGEVTVNFHLHSKDPALVRLTRYDDGAKPDAAGVLAFNEIAKALGKPPSTLLVALADMTGKMSDSQAWGAFLARLYTKSDCFAYVDKNQGLLWMTRIAPSPTTPAATTESKPASTVQKTQPPPDSGQSGFPTLLVVGVFVVGAAGGYFVGARAKKTPAPEVVVQPDSRERIANLVAEVEQLKSYKQFSQDHDAFQARIDAAVAESNTSTAKAMEAAKQLQDERQRVQALENDLRQAQAANAASLAEIEVQEAALEDLAKWGEYVGDRLAELTEKLEHE